MFCVPARSVMAEDAHFQNEMIAFKYEEKLEQSQLAREANVALKYCIFFVEYTHF